MIVAKEIKNQIKDIERGIIFSSQNFSKLGKQAAINKALSRMVNKGEIKRAAKGLFFRPRKNRFIEDVPISVEEVVRAIARKNKEIIQIHGSEAARRFGLTTQMPTKVVFYTNGATRKIKILNTEVQMLHTSNYRKLQYAGTNIGAAISALWYLGKELVTPLVIKTLKSSLSAEEFLTLKTANLTGWMKNIINAAELDNENNEKVML